nr:MAG TPA: hypothetical protein [Caudoviricetes sp.]
MLKIWSYPPPFFVSIRPSDDASDSLSRYLRLPSRRCSLCVRHAALRFRRRLKLVSARLIGRPGGKSGQAQRRRHAEPIRIPVV